MNYKELINNTQSLLVSQKNQLLEFYHSPRIYESRGKSIEFLIRETVNQYKISQNFNFIVNVDDSPIYNESKTYFFSTITNDYDKCFPCFIYGFWPELGLVSYREHIKSFIDNSPETKKIGWIGSPMSIPRQIFCSTYSCSYFTESIQNHWNRTDKNNLWKNTKTYLTYQQQIDRWKYLIDFEGAGYSGRTKILLNSPRIVFIVDRPYKEFWYKHLIPWKHYIPVARDLSDLETNYIKIEQDLELQKYIKESQKQFSLEWLSYEMALKQIYNIIEMNYES